jgi:protein-disulfide isomerase
MRGHKETVRVTEPKEIVIGDQAAPVSITMFGDYECDLCAKANEAITHLLDQYKGEVNFTFRHFPLTKIHQKAQKAAEAAVAAAQDGRFWEMHQLLFRNRKNLGIISLKNYAKEAGVVNKHFLTRLINGVYGWNVQGDLMEGLDRGIRNIPALYINGKRFEKEPSFENLSLELEKLIHKPDEEKQLS